MTEDPGTHKAFRPDEHAPRPGPGREESPEERDGVPDTDTTARTPLAVGESINKRAEDLAQENPTTEGHQGSAGRPYATGTASDDEGVDPNPSVTPGSPDLAAGDQGG